MLKRGRWRDKGYLAFVRQTPCLKCGSPYPSAHHVTYAQGVKAKALKVGDEWAVPLCHEDHMALHRFGNERLWWALLGVDPLEWCNRNLEKWRGKRILPLNSDHRH